MKHVPAIVCVSILLSGCGPGVAYKPYDPSDVRRPRPVGDVRLLDEDETPGPGYRTIGTVEVSNEVTCNTAMTMSKEGAKAIIDDYVKSHMDLADASSQEVVEAMVENGDLTKGQACKVLPIYSQIPEKEDILIGILKNGNIKSLLKGTADAGGDGLYEIEHEIYKTRKKPALSGAGAVSPSLVVNVKSMGKVITLKEEEPEEKPEKKPEKKPAKKTEEVVVVAKAEPPPAKDEAKDEEEEEEEEEPAPAKKVETVVVKKEVVVAKKEEPAPAKKEEPASVKKKEEPAAAKKAEAKPPELAPSPFDEPTPDEELDPKAAAEKAKKDAEEAMAAVKAAKKAAKEAKLAAAEAEKAKKKAAMAEKKAALEAQKKADAEAKKAAIEAKKKAAEEEAAKKKAEEEAKKKAKDKAKEPPPPELPKKADDETIGKAKNIVRGWKKEIFECLHKSDILESEGKAGLTFFIESLGQLDAISISPQPEATINDCVMKVLGDLDFPEIGINYDFTMKYKVLPED